MAEFSISCSLAILCDEQPQYCKTYAIKVVELENAKEHFFFKFEFPRNDNLISSGLQVWGKS
jgi:hypothetical protein